jgi:hypothetical protein
VKNKLSSLVEVINACMLLGLTGEVDILEVYRKDLQRISKALDEDDYNGEVILQLTGTEDVGMKIFTVAVDTFGSPSPEQTA